jgi:hypothetical protein
MATPSTNTVLTVLGILLSAVLTACDSTEHQAKAVKLADLPPLKAAPQEQALPAGEVLAGRNLTIALVGEVRGELEPCGCPTLPWGGFERRATQLKKLRTSGPGPVFHIDAGDTLVKGFATQRADKLEERAHEVLKLSELVGVDLWVVGPSDLMAISPTKLPSIKGPTRISATWMNADGAPLLKPSAILERDGLRLGVIGLSAAPSADSGLIQRDPVEAAKAALSTLPEDLDWVLAVSNLDEDATIRVAEAVPGLSVILSTRGTEYDTPELNRSPHTPIIETPDRGRYLQVIHARLGTKPDGKLLLHPEAPKWRARLSSVRRSEPDGLAEAGAGRNLALVNTIPLSADLDDMGPIRERLERYQEKRRIDAAARADTPDPHTSAYASSGACVNCHSDEFARWTLTKHAQAWIELVRRNETNNPECVGCHTTGYGEPGGLGTLNDTNIRQFKGVQCEECHGPMGGHPSDPDVTSSPVTRQACLKCHDEANSPEFNYETYLPHASCQGGAPAIVPRPASQEE